VTTSEVVVNANAQLTQAEAARVLNVADRTLESWRQKRIGPRFLSYSKRCVRYRLSDLNEWLAARAVDTSPDRLTLVELRPVLSARALESRQKAKQLTKETAREASGLRQI